MFRIIFLLLIFLFRAVIFKTQSKEQDTTTRWGTTQICAKKLQQISAISLERQLRICALKCPSQHRRAVWYQNLDRSPRPVSTIRPAAGTRQATGLRAEGWGGGGWNLCRAPVIVRVLPVYPREAWLRKLQVQLIFWVFLLEQKMPSNKWCINWPMSAPSQTPYHHSEGTTFL